MLERIYIEFKEYTNLNCIQTKQSFIRIIWYMTPYTLKLLQHYKNYMNSFLNVFNVIP